MKLTQSYITLPSGPIYIKRISLEMYFFSLARLASERSPCPSGKRHGAVITNKGYVISIGYNGPASGEKHCDICALEKKKSWDICPAIHAEENAILTAARFGMQINNLTMYVTKKPCEKCISRITNSGIARVFYL